MYKPQKLFHYINTFYKRYSTERRIIFVWVTTRRNHKCTVRCILISRLRINEIRPYVCHTAIGFRQARYFYRAICEFYWQEQVLQTYTRKRGKNRSGCNDVSQLDNPTRPPYPRPTVAIATDTLSCYLIPTSETKQSRSSCPYVWTKQISVSISGFQWLQSVDRQKVGEYHKYV